ncbi:CCA tRNA nucleotidyltransferase [Alkalithermobacter paradoxus]|uniref:CCA-adding enzyme n=1 Tax=Alkalithermobacter paradoxus TaxID=29349 RepID=A0A1V4IBP6_9FIRM|nr:CCA-adding enzyme [[Clostridium] thermoalcaliphilum]
MKINIPKEVEYIINKIEENGYEAFIVGGCVRDSLLGKIPNDFDITTNANPKTVLEIFKDEITIPTGLKHGTITLVINKNHYEITTYRIEGTYSDNRKPDKVEYTNDLIQDLKRRDFTINAMAYNKRIGLVDKFDGKKDLKNKIIRAVGNPDERFKEDALRMLRAIRFSSQLNFNIHKDTLNAISKNAELINNISSERIRDEINKILVSNNSGKIYLMHKIGLLRHIILELDEGMKTKQNNPYHIYNVGIHTLKSVKNIEPILHLRLSMLLHDIGKVKVKTTDENGIDHFYNHAKISSEISVEILKRLHYDNNTIEKVRLLTLYHDSKIHPNKKSIKKWLNRIGKENLDDLLKVKLADNLAKNSICHDEIKKEIKEIKEILKKVVESNECFTIKDLAISGKDIMNLGYNQGKEIGIILNEMLEIVIDNPDLNNKDYLLNIIKTKKHFL